MAIPCRGHSVRDERRRGYPSSITKPEAEGLLLWEED